MSEHAPTLKAIRQIVKEEVGDQLQPLREEMREWKNDILNSNDKVAREIKDLRIEVTAFHGGQRRQDETLADHEHRIRRVEEKVPA